MWDQLAIFFFGFSWFKVIFGYTFHALYGYIKYKATKYNFFSGISNASCFTLFEYIYIKLYLFKAERVCVVCCALGNAVACDVQQVGGCAPILQA